MKHWILNTCLAWKLVLGLQGTHWHGLIETQCDVCHAFEISIWPRATKFGIPRTDSILCQFLPLQKQDSLNSESQSRICPATESLWIVEPGNLQVNVKNHYRIQNFADKRCLQIVKYFQLINCDSELLIASTMYLKLLFPHRNRE